MEAKQKQSKGVYRGKRKRRRGKFSQKAMPAEGFYEPISYKSLMRAIKTNHPVDPGTNKTFPFNTRITVKDYAAKLSDICFCYDLFQSTKKCRRYFKSHVQENIDVFVKPHSLRDIPSSSDCSSESEDNPHAKGLTLLTQSLSEGSALYL